MVVADPRAEERVGSVLHDKWTLERLLGVGGMGAVYAARHRNGARAAVKVLSPASGREPTIRDRFLREGYAANRVEHGGAVKVLDDDVIQEGADQGTAYLVMELLEGESLHDRSRREPPLTERDLLVIADDVLAVLDSAHANGVVHRDLKPDNLFLAQDSERDGVILKVLDFGLARLLEAREQTQAGMALGTPTYMSPEQAAGHVKDIDGRTDIYALGSILFQLISNKRIHDAAHTLGLVVRMATTPAPKLRTVAPDVSEGLARIVDHALEFKREDRYPTAAAMRADVQSALALCEGDPSTVNVVSSSRPPSSKLGADTTKAAALADTVVAIPAPAWLAREEPKEPPGDPSTPPPAVAPSRSLFRLVIACALAGAAAFVVFDNRAAIGRLAASSVPASSSVSTTASVADAGLSLPTTADADAEPELDAGGALVLAGGDAAVDELLDASSIDGGEDDDDDDDDDDLDAASEAAAPSPSIAAGPRRPPHVAKPHRKPTRPRRGPPRRKRRWH